MFGESYPWIQWRLEINYLENEFMILESFPFHKMTLIYKIDQSLPSWSFVFFDLVFESESTNIAQAALKLGNCRFQISKCLDWCVTPSPSWQYKNRFINNLGIDSSFKCWERVHCRMWDEYAFPVSLTCELYFKKRTRILQWKRESRSSPAIISLDASLSQTSNNVKNSSLPISRMTIRRPGEISLWILCLIPEFRLLEITWKARRGAKHSIQVVISIVRDWVSREKDKMKSEKTPDIDLWSPRVHRCVHLHTLVYVQLIYTRVTGNVEECHIINALPRLKHSVVLIIACFRL